MKIDLKSDSYLFSFDNFLLILAQLLIAGQVSTTCNLILTVIFLRLFHHGSSPVPRKLRHLVFKVIAPMVFFDVKEDSKSAETITQVEPSSKENGKKLNSVDRVEKANMESLMELLRSLKHRERSKDEIYTGEWQTVAKILDRLLFTLNILSMIIAFGYGYTKLYTY